MTLLERWDNGNFSTDDYELDAAIRRAIAIAQVVEEIKYDRLSWIIERVNKLLAKEKTT